MKESELVPAQELEDEGGRLSEGAESLRGRTEFDPVDVVFGALEDDHAIACRDDVAVPGDVRSVGELGDESARDTGKDQRSLVHPAGLASDVADQGERTPADTRGAQGRPG